MKIILLMMAAYNYHLIGRAFCKEDPHFFRLLNSKVKECQDNSIGDTNLIKSYFHYFCQNQGLQPEDIRQETRRTVPHLIAIRRLFIAVIIKQFDKLYFEDYAGRMADKLRKSISDCLNCNEVWVSNVAPSVKVELKRRKDYNSEVESIIEAIEPQIGDAIEIPEYYNSRSLNGQISMF
jgi:hypothetical protein